LCKFTEAADKYRVDERELFEMVRMEMPFRPRSILDPAPKEGDKEFKYPT